MQSNNTIPPMSISHRKKKDILNRSSLYLFLLILISGLISCEGETESVSMGEDDIAGVVRGPNGPEAGVWVIAETHDLPTRYAKIVVTDDEGRYLIPELPDASYSVWVRGYGLVDSPKKTVKPGSQVDLEAVVADDPREAAEYYPAGYWFSLLDVPDKSHFPGDGPDGNGIAPHIKTQAQFLRDVKSGTCLACHQMGSKGTRELPENLGTFDSSVDAWERRLQSGQAGGMMVSAVHQWGRDKVLEMFADWTDRIAEGEIPPTPPRPEGIERNVVITQWDWADPKAYLHDLVSTDRRDPTVNANGLIYGALEASADGFRIAEVDFEILCPSPSCVLNTHVYWEERTHTGGQPVQEPFDRGNGTSGRCPVPALTVDDQQLAQGRGGGQGLAVPERVQRGQGQLGVGGRPEPGRSRVLLGVRLVLRRRGTPGADRPGPHDAGPGRARAGLR
jgi:hypothetical protein